MAACRTVEPARNKQHVMPNPHFEHVRILGLHVRVAPQMIPSARYLPLDLVVCIPREGLDEPITSPRQSVLQLLQIRRPRAGFDQGRGQFWAMALVPRSISSLASASRAMTDAGPTTHPIRRPGAAVLERLPK